MTRSEVSTYSSSSLMRPEAHVVHPGAAVLLRHRAPEQAELGHLRNDRRVEAMLPIQLANPRGDFARSPFAYRLFEQPLLFGQIEIKHEDGPLNEEKKTK